MSNASTVIMKPAKLREKVVGTPECLVILFKK
jgi:hypothetical protein